MMSSSAIPSAIPRPLRRMVRRRRGDNQIATANSSTVTIGSATESEFSRSTAPWTERRSLESTSTIVGFLFATFSKTLMPRFWSRWSIFESTGPSLTTTLPFLVSTVSVPFPCRTATTCVCALRLSPSQSVWNWLDSANFSVAACTNPLMPVAR